MDERKFEYPDLNLNPLLGDGRYAVHCSAIEEAKHFVNQIKKQYPTKARGWNYGQTNWHSDCEMCYAPYLNENDTMCWCEREYYEEEGFTILEFSDLLPDSDLEESEQSLDFLLS